MKKPRMVNWVVGTGIDFARAHGDSLIKEMDEHIRKAIKENKRRERKRGY